MMMAHLGDKAIGNRSASMIERRLSSHSQARPAIRPARTWCQSIAPRVSLAEGARCQNQVMSFGQHWAGDLAEQVAAIGAVAVEEDDDGSARGLGAGVAGAPVASAGMEDRGTGGGGDVAGGVGAAAVGDDDFPDEVSGNFADGRQRSPRPR